MGTREAAGIDQPSAGVADSRAERELVDFVDAHYDRLLRLARIVSRNTADAADAVQIALEQAWKSRGSLRDPSRLRPWLDRIVVREAIRIDRRHRGFLGLHSADRRKSRSTSLPTSRRHRSQLDGVSRRVRPAVRGPASGHCPASPRRLLGRRDGTDRRRERGDGSLADPSRQGAACVTTSRKHADGAPRPRRPTSTPSSRRSSNGGRIRVPGRRRPAKSARRIAERRRADRPAPLTYGRLAWVLIVLAVSVALVAATAWFASRPPVPPPSATTTPSVSPPPSPSVRVQPANLAGNGRLRRRAG